VPDGVGDYASLLAQALRQHAGLESLFLQGTTAAAAPPRHDCWPTLSVPKRTSDALLMTLSTVTSEYSPSAVLAHVSLYGYQSRGLPAWLPDGLERWKAQHRDVPLIMMFHEVWAADARDPLTSSFWTAPLQRRIVGRLRMISDALVTTTQRYQQLLGASARSGPQAVVLNVFSNVGEPDEVLAPDERPSRMVIFGGMGSAQLAAQHAGQMGRLLAAAGITEIVDIGKRSQQMPGGIDSIPVVARGMLPAADVSAILSESRIGILPYPNRSVLGKSGIMAAYAAHGVVPVAMQVSHEDADGLNAGLHYMTASAPVASSSALKSVQTKLLEWYRGHALGVQAQHYAAIIRAAIRAQ